MVETRDAGNEEPGARERARLLARGFLLLLAIAYGLIVLGALVRAHGAGLACPDWPLCFGALIPRFDFHVAFEWGHRLLAGSVSLLFLALGFAVLRDPVLRRVAGGPVLVAAALLALQVVLGGLTVLHLLASWTVTAHLVTGNAFALVLLLTALRLRDHAADAAPPPAPISPQARTLVSVGAAVLALQIVLGGLVSSRYAGLACPDWPSCAQGVFFPTFDGIIGLQIAHRLNAYALILVMALAAASVRGVPGLARTTAMALAVLLLQIAIGVSNVWLGIPVEITALHSATAAALVLTMTLCVRSAWKRPLAAARTETPGPASAALPGRVGSPGGRG